MAGKDIDVVIRAKDKASKEFDAIAKSVKEYNKEQTDIVKGAGKTSKALGDLGSDVTKLQKNLDNLKSAGKIAVELDKATAAASRMESSIKGSTVELAKLARQSDDAAQAANRLQGALEAEKRVQAENKNALAASRKELIEINKAVRTAESIQKKYNETLAKPKNVKPSSALRSAGTFVAADLAGAKAAQTEVNAQIKAYQSAINQSSAAIKELKPQVSSATALQKSLATETERAATALQSERTGLAAARTELESIRGISTQAGTALGTVALSQEQVSAAAQRMAANLAAAKARIEGLSSIKTASVDPAAPGTVDSAALNAQRRQMLEARKEYVASQAAVKALAVELKTAQSPTLQLGEAFGRAQAQARAAKLEYEAQRGALARLSSGAQSSFAAFSQGAAQVRAAASTTSAGNAKIASSATNAATAERSLTSILRQVATDMVGAANKTDQFTKSLQSMQNGSRQSLSLMQRLRGEVLSVTASYVGFQAAIGQVGGAVTAYQKLEAVQSRLGAVFKQDTGRVAQEVQFLREQADRLGISFGTLADEYGKFTVAANTANFTTGETRKIFLSVAEAARVNRLSTEQTSGVFLALTQMISKGKVSSEELRRQLGDRLTGAFNIFASAIGVSTAELDKMMQAGEVLADRGTLLKFADEMTKRFGPQLGAALNSASTDIGRFENNIFGMQLTIANGLVPGLRAALQSFDEFSKSAEGQETFIRIGETVGKLLQLLAEVPKYFDEITFAAKIFAAVKIAEVFTGMLMSIVKTTAASAAMNRELQLIGPRTQAAAAAQGILSRGFSQTVSTLASYRQNLLASTSQTALARAGVIGLASAVGGLRAALLLTGSIARGFLAAFGGVPGLIITGITLAVGSWLTSVDKATTALSEHERQLQKVSAGYQDAKAKATDFSKGIAGVTLAQAIKSTEDLRASFKSTVKDMNSLSLVLKAGFSDFGPESAEIQQYQRMADAIKQVGDGTLDVKGLSDVLNEIALNPADEHFKEIALQLLEIVNVAQDGEPSLQDLSDALAKSEAKARVLAGTATDTDLALLGLKEAVEETTTSFDRNAAIKTYTDAIDTLKSKIPGLAEEMKKLKDITELNKTAWDGMVAAFKAGDMQALANIIKLWSQAGAARQAESDSKLMEAWPGGGKTIRDRIKFIEGGQKITDKQPTTSSAQGIGQFTGPTWLRLFDRIFPELAQLNETQKLALRFNEEAADKMLDALTQENQAALVKAGFNPTPGNTYLAHFLGSGDAVKVLLANPEELAKNVVQESSTKANPTVIKDSTSVQDLINWANMKMGGGSPIMSGGMTKQENTDQDIQLRVKSLREEAEARRESNREGAIAKEIAQAEAQATKDGTILTKEQIAALREAAGAKYDSLHADEALKVQQEAAREALNQIIGLDQQRKTLLEQINMAQQAGDNAKTAELITQLTGINGQLDQLIPKALEFARALGDEKMVAQLQKVQLHTAKVGQQFSLFGLSLNQTKQLAGSFADGLVGVFDSFAQAIANGEDAMKALGTAFLQFAADFLRQIAMMILKQMVLNALQRFLPGLGSFGAGHTGGMVGSAAIGGGNISRQVSPMWFSTAMRYHSGGIAGLRPDEVPAVLKKNEEVLTEEDPRHRYNNKEERGSQAASQPIKQVLVLDPRDLANAMHSTHGEKVILTTLKNNVQTLKTLLG